jgi:hypothetical protein
MSRKILLAGVGCAAMLLGCAHSGLSGSVHGDITATMETAKPTITACYERQLKLDRKERGMIVVTFTAAPKTGAFQEVAVVQDDMNDKTLEKCVTDAVGALKLPTPQKSKVAITYPLDFAPTK